MHKINTHKSLSFLYTKNEKSEKLRNQSHSPLQQKRIKYLEISLLKERKEPCTENYKTLMKKIKDDTNRWKDMSSSWIKRINIMKVTKQSIDSVQSQSNYRWRFS